MRRLTHTPRQSRRRSGKVTFTYACTGNCGNEYECCHQRGAPVVAVTSACPTKGCNGLLLMQSARKRHAKRVAFRA
jgi:hypothetical protein